MPHGSLEYQFDEPLYVEGSREGGSISGTASINYDRDGMWSVAEIWLDGWDRKLRKHTQPIQVPKDSEVFRILHGRLTVGQTSEFIGSDVWEAVEADQAEAA